MMYLLDVVVRRRRDEHRTVAGSSAIMCCRRPSVVVVDGKGRQTVGSKFKPGNASRRTFTVEHIMARPRDSMMRVGSDLVAWKVSVDQRVTSSFVMERHMTVLGAPIGQDEIETVFSRGLECKSFQTLSIHSSPLILNPF